MGGVLILAEKPNQALAYSTAMTSFKKCDGYFDVSDPIFGEAKITYGFGHLVELAEPTEYSEEYSKWSLDNLPILPQQYKFRVGKGKSKQFNIVKKLLKEADEIIIATDCDREGENIARSIIELAQCSDKKTKRLWINSLERDEIRKGFSELKEGKDFYNKYIEAQTRQIADWLVGINISRLYTCLMQQNGLNETFSIGRVQTPTLFLVYQKEKSIADFKPQNFYEVEGIFITADGEGYRGKLNQKFDSPTDLKTFLNENGVLKSKDAQGVVVKYETNRKETSSPKLYSLSNLQEDMNKRYKVSPAQTLEIVQSLYESKLLSYPRTDCNYITESELHYLQNNLSDYLNTFNLTIKSPNMNPGKRYVNGEKVQEHYAIIPTKKTLSETEFNKLNDNEKQVYELVLKRTLAMFEEKYQYDETEILTKVGQIHFKTIGKTVINSGFKKILNDEEGTKDEEVVLLPQLKLEQQVRAELKGKEGVTKPPKSFTEGTLITGMKNVGRIIDDVTNKDILKETEGIGTEATRANILETLKRQSYITVVKNKVKLTEKGAALCEIIKNREISSAEMTAKWESYLKKIGDGEGSQEKFLLSIERFIKYLLSEAPNDVKNGAILINKIKEDKEQNENVGNCPKCGKIVKEKSKVFACTNTECEFILFKKILNKTLSASNVRMLLSDKRQTNLIKGLVGKSGKTFDAYITFNDSYSTTFQFPKRGEK